MTNAERCKEHRRLRKEKGLCQRCGTPVSGRVLCEECNNKLRAIRKEKRKAGGYCNRCSAKCDGYVCDKCRPMYLKEQIEFKRRRFEKGLCARCGVDMEGESGTECPNCAELRREHQWLKESL